MYSITNPVFTVVSCGSKTRGDCEANFTLTLNEK